MENRKVSSVIRIVLFVVILSMIGGLAFAAGLAWSSGSASADEPKKLDPSERTEFPTFPATRAIPATRATQAIPTSPPKGKVIYPKETELDFEGMQIKGELRNPGEFYFQHRPEEKFDSLVKRRKSFHREMLRDAVAGK